MLPEIDNETAKSAIQVTVGGGLLGIIWRIVLGVRRDLRGDSAQSSTQHVFEAALAQQAAQIASLVGQVSRLEAHVGVLNEHMAAKDVRINEEIHRRYIAENQLRRAETEEQGLRAEVLTLRTETEDLEGEMEDLRDRLSQFRAGDLP